MWDNTSLYGLSQFKWPFMSLEVKGILTGKATEQVNGRPRSKLSTYSSRANAPNCSALYFLLCSWSWWLLSYRWKGWSIKRKSDLSRVTELTRADPGSELMFIWLQSPHSLQGFSGFPHFWLPPFLYLWLQTEPSPSPNNVIKSNLLSIQLENITGYSKKCKNLQSRSKLINFYY